MTNVRALLVFSAIVLMSARAGAADMPKEDFPGSKDHPLLSRYAGSKIVAYKTKLYDELWMPAGPREDGHTPPFKNVVRLEGKITRRDRKAIGCRCDPRVTLMIIECRIYFDCSTTRTQPQFRCGVLAFSSKPAVSLVAPGKRPAYTGSIPMLVGLGPS